MLQVGGGGRRSGSRCRSRWRHAVREVDVGPTKNGRWRWNSSVTVSGRAWLRHAGENAEDRPDRSPSRPDRRRAAAAMSKKMSRSRFEAARTSDLWSAPGSGDSPAGGVVLEKKLSQFDLRLVRHGSRLLIRLKRIYNFLYSMLVYTHLLCVLLHFVAFLYIFRN
jgi:hypothetical protein